MHVKQCLDVICCITYDNISACLLLLKGVPGENGSKGANGTKGMKGEKASGQASTQAAGFDCMCNYIIIQHDEYPVCVHVRTYKCVATSALMLATFSAKKQASPL